MSARAEIRGRTRSPEDARRALLPYLGVIVASSVVVQGTVTAQGNRITALTGLLVAVIALVYVAFLLVMGRALGRVRFGRFVAHSLTYLVVNLGFVLHAGLLLAAGPSIIGERGIEPGWSGVLLTMPGVWGCGLLLHAFGALMQRGFEAPRP